jgi:hypothetical protein
MKNNYTEFDLAAAPTLVATANNIYEGDKADLEHATSGLLRHPGHWRIFLARLAAAAGYASASAQ